RVLLWAPGRARRRPPAAIVNARAGGILYPREDAPPHRSRGSIDAFMQSSDPVRPCAARKPRGVGNEEPASGRCRGLQLARARLRGRIGERANGGPKYSRFLPTGPTASATA